MSELEYGRLCVMRRTAFNEWRATHRKTIWARYHRLTMRMLALGHKIDDLANVKDDQFYSLGFRRNK
jgi:hypothetical protein